LTSNARLASSALTEWLEPTGLHHAGDSGRIIAIAFVDLHLEHCLGVPRVDADHWQAEPLEFCP
jgi:hypothetical protein